MKHVLVLMVIMQACLFRPGFSQSVSEAGALFLTLLPTSRANAMGGAQTAVADDFNALYFNPAGIARLQKGAAGFYRHDWFTGAPVTFTSAVYKTKFGSVGFAFNDFSIETGGRFGEVLNSYERAFQFTYARQFNSHLAVGGSLKLVREKFDQGQGLQDVTANAWGLDFGVLVQNVLPHLTYVRRNESFPEQFQKFARERPRGLSLGLALLNTGPDKLSFIDENQADPLPQILRLGAAVNAMDTEEVSVLVALDLDKILVEKQANGQVDNFAKSWFSAWDGGFDNFHVGAEVGIYHVFAFRFGRDESLNFGPDGENVGEWTYGFGFGPEWARLNLVRRSFPIAAGRDKWVVDFSLAR